MFPHTLSARPLVINSSSTIRLRFSHRRSDLEISCDSQIALPIQEGEDVLIRRCDYHLNLIHPKDYSYFNTLSTKLGWSKNYFNLPSASLLYKNQFILYVITVMVFIQENSYVGTTDHQQFCYRS